MSPTARTALRTRWGRRVLLAGLPISLACAFQVSSASPPSPSDTIASTTPPSIVADESPVPEPAPIVVVSTLADPVAPVASPEQIAAALAEAEQIVDTLGIRAKLRRAPAGPLPELAFLELAYHEGRAFALAGDLEQVRSWMALAKFGHEEPGATPSRGQLAHFDLIVTRDDDRAWLHVIVPPAGPTPNQLGRHEAYLEGERWTNLADRLQAGRHYLPYKTNGNESLACQWGRADVIETIATIAEEYRQRTGTLLGVGDISHVAGGKILDHWTHREGVDVDLYLLDHDHVDHDHDQVDHEPAPARPRVWWHHFRKDRSVWSSEPLGKGQREARLDPDDELSDTPSSQRLRVLAQIVFPLDPVAYFVHDDPRVLTSFDREVGERRPGRRFLHAENRGMWPRHCDHVHLRWVDGNLPVEGTPRP